MKLRNLGKCRRKRKPCAGHGEELRLEPCSSGTSRYEVKKSNIHVGAQSVERWEMPKGRKEVEGVWAERNKQT